MVISRIRIRIRICINVIRIRMLDSRPIPNLTYLRKIAITLKKKVQSPMPLLLFVLEYLIPRSPEGIVSWDESFFVGLESRWLKQKILMPCCEENLIKSFCQLLWKHLLILKILTKSLPRACSGCQIAHASKNCYESRLSSWKWFQKPPMTYIHIFADFCSIQ